jgi:hypothetical protein
MDIRELLASGKRLLLDTKTPRKVAAKTAKMEAPLGEPTETDPYRVFSKRVIHEKPKKSELIKDIKRFIETAEALL